MLKKASSPIADLVRDLGLENSMKLQRLRERWSFLVGPQMARHLEPQSLKSGELVVFASSSAWLAEANFQKAQLIEKLRPLEVNRIRLMLGRIQNKPAPTGKPPEKTVEITPEHLALIQSSTSEIKDENLKYRIRSAMTRWARSPRSRRNQP